MRLTTVLLIACLMQVSAAGLAQKISLNERNAPLSTVLKSIKKQSGYGFLFKGKNLPTNQRVTVELNNVTVPEALNEVFKGLDLSYEIEGNLIAIKPKESPALIDKAIARFQKIDVQGKVLDENGSPMSGVTVKVKGEVKVVITNAKGEFKLTSVNEPATVVVSYVGYKTVELPASPDLGQVKMETTESVLDQVQVTAYGKTSQRLSVGNIATITSKDLEKSIVNNPILALQGRVPGITIIQGGGNANSAITVKIQGRSSIAGDSEPFYVIDGVPYNSTYFHAAMPIPNWGGDGRTNGGSPLSFINPDDIESISVLKDADATAIYGSRAAFGAIIITTKKARTGKTKLDINVYHGVSDLSRRYRMLNTEQYLMMRNEAFQNDGGSVGPTNYDVNGMFWDNSRSTDWQKELFGETAKNSNYNFSLSGGSGNTSYQFSNTFNRSTTIYPGDFGSTSFASHLGVNSSSLDQRLLLQVTLNYVDNRNKLPSGNVTASAISLPPNAPPLLNDDGSVNWWLNDAGNPTFANPYPTLLETYQGNTTNLFANALISYELSKGIVIKNSVGYNDLGEYTINKLPLASIPINELPFRDASGSFINSRNVSWITEPQLSFRHGYSFGQISANLGASIQQRKGRSEAIDVSGFLSEETMDDIGSASRVDGKSSNGASYKYFGVFGNISYNFGDRFLLNLAARRDGSSRFGNKNKFNNFWSVGTGWAFTEEPLFKDKTGALSFGKIRVSYGVTGSDQIGDYSFLQLYSFGASGVPYGDHTSLVSGGFTNPYLQWEENRKWNLGLDLGFFSDKLTLTFNYNRNRSSNQLLSYIIPGFTGATQINSNFPATVQNSGLEFTISSKNIETKNVRWSTNLNLTAAKNKLLRFDNIEETPYRNLIVGQSLNVIQVLKYDGVNPNTGLHQFVELDGGLTSEPKDQDRYVKIDPTQNLYGGIENSISFLDFDFSFLIQLVKQRSQDINGSPQGFQPGRAYRNMTTDVLRRWQYEGQYTDVQKFSTNAALPFINFVTNSDQGWVDASYIKFRNANLSYSIPKDWQRVLKMQNLKVYAQAQNLWTVTGYKGLDPEGSVTSGIPPLRTIVFGIRGSF